MRKLQANELPAVFYLTSHLFFINISKYVITSLNWKIFLVQRIRSTSPGTFSSSPPSHWRKWLSAESRARRLRTGNEQLATAEPRNFASNVSQLRESEWVGGEGERDDDRVDGRTNPFKIAAARLPYLQTKYHNYPGHVWVPVPHMYTNHRKSTCMHVRLDVLFMRSNAPTLIIGLCARLSEIRQLLGITRLEYRGEGGGSITVLRGWTDLGWAKVCCRVLRKLRASGTMVFDKPGELWY